MATSAPNGRPAAGSTSTTPTTDDKQNGMRPAPYIVAGFRFPPPCPDTPGGFVRAVAREPRRTQSLAGFGVPIPECEHADPFGSEKACGQRRAATGAWLCRTGWAGVSAAG